MPASRSVITRIRPTLVALCVAALIALGAAFVFEDTLEELGKLSDQRGALREGRLQLAQTLSLFKDLETGARGFVLTGAEDYLEPYTLARAALPEAYAETRQIATAGQIEGFPWAELDRWVDERIRLAGELVQTRRLPDWASTATPHIFDEGKRAMDSIRSLMGRLDALEAARVDALSQQIADLRRRATLLGWTAALAIVVLIGSSSWLLLAERRARLGVEQQLRDANQHLEARVAIRTTELREARERIAAFATGQEQFVEAERRRIAREVHDQIGAVFTGIKLIFRSLPPGSLPAAQERALLEAVEMGVATARRISAELRPPLLDDLGLEAALERLLEGMFRNSQVIFAVELTGHDALDERQALSVYRIVQEAATNVLRHAAALHFAVSGGLADDNSYRITLLDDGIGMAAAPDHRPATLGLTGMHERAELLGGTLSFASEPSGGTSLKLRLPLARPRRDANEHPAA